MKKKTGSGIFIFFLMSLLSFTFLYPLYYMLINSLKTKNEYLIDSFAPPPTFNTENFYVMFRNFDILNNFKNTLIVTLTSMAIIITLSTFASYAFAKLRFRGKSVAYLLIISTMFIPAQVTMIPLYYMYAKAGLINTYASVILAYVSQVVPGSILLLTSNFRGITNEMIDAAKIDGAGYFTVVRSVVVPMGSAAIATNVVFIFVSLSNDLFTAMILLQKTNLRTVMVALASLMSDKGGEPSLQMAGLFMSAIPPLVIYLAFQRFFVKGLTMGSFK